LYYILAAPACSAWQPIYSVLACQTGAKHTLHSSPLCGLYRVVHVHVETHLVCVCVHRVLAFAAVVQSNPTHSVLAGKQPPDMLSSLHYVVRSGCKQPRVLSHAEPALLHACVCSCWLLRLVPSSSPVSTHCHSVPNPICSVLAGFWPPGTLPSALLLRSEINIVLRASITTGTRHHQLLLRTVCARCQLSLLCYQLGSNRQCVSRYWHMQNPARVCLCIGSIVLSLSASQSAVCLASESCPTLLSGAM
jgi:hypothetical protein